MTNPLSLFYAFCFLFFAFAVLFLQLPYYGIVSIVLAIASGWYLWDTFAPEDNQQDKE